MTHGTWPRAGTKRRTALRRGRRQFPRAVRTRPRHERCKSL